MNKRKHFWRRNTCPYLCLASSMREHHPIVSERVIEAARWSSREKSFLRNSHSSLSINDFCMVLSGRYLIKLVDLFATVYDGVSVGPVSSTRSSWQLQSLALTKQSQAHSILQGNGEIKEDCWQNPFSICLYKQHVSLTHSDILYLHHWHQCVLMVGFGPLLVQLVTTTLVSVGRSMRYRK